MEYVNVNYLEELISICKSKCGDLDETDIRTAYEYSKEILSAEYKDPEKVIRHSLREAARVAGWGLGKDIVISALLHEAFDCGRIPSREGFADKFGDNVLQIAESVFGMGDSAILGHDRNRLSLSYDDFPHKKALNNAIYVKTADRIDKLMYGDEVLNLEPVVLVSMTQRTFMRLVKHINAYRFVDELEELCFRIDRPDAYKEIQEQCEALRNENIRSFLKTENKIREVFDPEIENGDNELADYHSQIRQLVIEERSPASIFRYLSRETKMTFDEWKTCLCKEKVPFYDITLVVDDKLSEYISKFGPNDVFFKCFEKSFMNKGIYITAHEFNTRNERDFFVLSDEADNLYRVYVRTQKEYKRYLYGDIADEPDFQFRNEKQEMELPEPRRPKIKVYRDDGTAVLITNGATVLDLAFYLYAGKGLHFAYAMINGSKTKLDRNVRLNEGDTVTIVTDKNVLPDITWFESARTGMATKYLVDHFSKRENLARLL